ncbi:MAG: peptidylprolyl isomerase [Alphaproteobacteria bacterium]
MTFCLRFLSVVCLMVGALFAHSVLSAQPAVAGTYQIAAVVNDDAISVRDLNKRLRLVMASSGLPNNKEIRQKLTPQVLGGLINEKIMLQEAAKMDIAVEEAEIDGGFATVAQQNKKSPKQFSGMLKRAGIDMSTMRAQIKAQIAWSKVVQAKLRPKIIISERDIDAAYERTQAKIGTTEYLTAEIYLPVYEAKADKSVKQLANRLVREIKGGKASFFKLAQQFSRAAGSMKGGDTGWTDETQISEEVLAALKSVKKNQVTQPIKTLSGYHIMFLRDTRTLSEESLPSKNQIEYNLGTERLNKLQGRHLQDLKAASFVDIRG